MINNILERGYKYQDIKSWDIIFKGIINHDHTQSIPITMPFATLTIWKENNVMNSTDKGKIICKFNMNPLFQRKIYLSKLAVKRS